MVKANREALESCTAGTSSPGGERPGGNRGQGGGCFSLSRPPEVPGPDWKAVWDRLWLAEVAPPEEMERILARRRRRADGVPAEVGSLELSLLRRSGRPAPGSPEAEK